MNANAARRTVRKLVKAMAEVPKPPAKRGRKPKAPGAEVVPFPAKPSVVLAGDVPPLTHDGLRLIRAFYRLSAKQRALLLAQAEAGLTK